jgi:hypothetical protein
LAGLEPFLERKGHDRTGITSFDNEAHFKLTELVKISGQVIFTERVPDETICLFRTSDEKRGGAKGETSFTKTDDEVHRFVRKELFGLLSDLFLNHRFTKVRSF